MVYNVGIRFNERSGRKLILSAHKPTMYTVYALVDPRDDTTRYIGITDDVYVRFSQHRNCIGNNLAKNAWIEELKRLQIVFFMKVIEQFPDVKTARKREIYWIRHHIKNGSPLTNIAEHKVQPPPILDVPTGNTVGRRMSKSETHKMLAHVQQHKVWPEGVSKQMRAYYRREYPEYFRRRRRKTLTDQ